MITRSSHAPTAQARNQQASTANLTATQLATSIEGFKKKPELKPPATLQKHIFDYIIQQDHPNKSSPLYTDLDARYRPAVAAFSQFMTKHPEASSQAILNHARQIHANFVVTKSATDTTQPQPGPVNNPKNDASKGPIDPKKPIYVPLDANGQYNKTALQQLAKQGLGTIPELNSESILALETKNKDKWKEYNKNVKLEAPIAGSYTTESPYDNPAKSAYPEVNFLPDGKTKPAAWTLANGPLRDVPNGAAIAWAATKYGYGDEPSLIKLAFACEVESKLRADYRQNSKDVYNPITGGAIGLFQLDPNWHSIEHGFNIFRNADMALGLMRYHPDFKPKGKIDHDMPAYNTGNPSATWNDGQGPYRNIDDLYLDYTTQKKNNPRLSVFDYMAGANKAHYDAIRNK